MANCISRRHTLQESRKQAKRQNERDCERGLRAAVERASENERKNLRLLTPALLACTLTCFAFFSKDFIWEKRIFSQILGKKVKTLAKIQAKQAIFLKIYGEVIYPNLQRFLQRRHAGAIRKSTNTLEFISRGIRKH